MKLPLFNAVSKHSLMDMSSFHTPGHKNGRTLLSSNLLDFDITELPGTDSLYEPNSVILESEQLTSELFGVKKTLFSAGGCTLCIQTMLRLVCPSGGKIISGRTIHKSAINAMALLGIDPVWILPQKNAGKYLPGRICSNDIAYMLSKHPDACAVYLTSPDYFGVISDVEAIADECKKFGIPLIVDNAHGSHLMFVNDKLDPIRLGASMAAYSAHKTLPVLTGGAWLNINDDKFIEGAKDAMSLFGSTSPSYPVMVSLDLCRQWLEINGKSAFSKFELKVEEFKKLILQKGMDIPNGVCDPVRISFSALRLGYLGTEIADLLRESKMEPEYSNEAYVVLIPTPINSELDFKRLEDFILNLKSKKPINLESLPVNLPQKCLSPREALLSKKTTVNLKNAIGMIAAETLCPCPPGIPVVMPGELLDANCVEFLLNYGYSSIKVVL